MNDTARIYLTVPDDKLADVLRMLDAGNSPEACAMIHGCDLIHVPAPEQKPERIPFPYGM